MAFQKGNKLGKGRPTRKQSLTEQVRRYAAFPHKHLLELISEVEGKKCRLPALEVGAIRIVLGLTTGEAITKEVWDRIDGKVPVPIGNPDGTSLNLSPFVVVKYAKGNRTDGETNGGV